MSKHELIDHIRRHSRGIDEAFLMRFDVPQLDAYWRRLSTLEGHRGRDSRWVRESTSMAIVTRRRAA
jgi:hypothetical protein